jgi:hypothetical protein
MAASIAPVPVTSAAAPVSPVAAPQLALQPGTVITAQVLQVLEDGLAKIAIDGIAIAALSEVPLQVGDALKLAVSQATDGVVRLSIVPPNQAGANAVATGASASAGAAGGVSVGSTSAASNTSAISTSAPATPVSAEAVAITAAIQAAAPRQQSLSPLFANLPVVVASGSVPSAVQAGASQLLALRPELTEQLSASDLRTAFDQSGLFLEASLASGGAPTPSTDLKAALVTFRDAVSNWLAASGEGVAPELPVQLASTPAAPSLVPSQTTTAVAPGASSAQPAVVQSATIVAAAAAEVLVTTEASSAAATQPVTTAQPAPQLALTQEPLLQIASAALPANPLIRALPPATSLTIAAFEAAQKPVEGDAVRGAIQPTLLTSIKALQAILSVAGITRSPVEADAQAAPGSARVFAAASSQGDAASAPPPFRGAAPAAQAIALASLAPDATPKDAGQHLLEQTDGAIARQTLLQVASLPDRTDAVGTQFSSQVSDNSTQRWNFEIPFATPQGTALAQFEIERDGSGNQVEATAQKVWRARFTLNIEPTGPVHALVSLVGEKTAVRMWAERPETAATIRARSGDLAQALRAAELQPGDIVVSGGAPPSGPAKAGHFLNRAS